MAYTTSLFDLQGQVKAYKPNSKAGQIQKDANARIRALLDFRNSWSDLITRYVINIPNAYVTGGITTVSGSPNISGVATYWPYNDVVNTTFVNGNRTTGYCEIQPASMSGIAVDTNLFVSDSTFSEVVSVIEVTQSTFTAQFQYSHNDGTPLTCSSLAGLQIQYGPLTPVYTLLAVSSGPDGSGNNTGIMDNPWGGASLTNAGYQLIKAYITIPNFRSWIVAYDPQQGIPLGTNVSQAEIDAIDAQRTSQGWPQCFADLGPSASGNYQSELWPYQTTAYAIPILYNRQWPTLKRPTDRLPGFINPSVIIDGCIADALRRQDLRDNSDKDPYYSPSLAREFDQKFLAGAIAAANADEERCVQRLSSSMWQPGGSGFPGASYWQSHVNGDLGLGW